MNGDKKPARKRWRWTKRFYAALIVFFLVTIAARIWWGYHAECQLREVLDRIAARGEPIEWADLAPPEVPDDENAALLYKKAAQIPLFTTERTEDDYDFDIENMRMFHGRPEPNAEEKRLYRLWSMVDDLVKYPKFRSEHEADLREIVKESREALDLCRKARGLKQADWGMDFSGPAISALVPSLRATRQVAKLLCLAAIEAHERGDDAAALEYIRDTLALGDSFSSVPCLVSHLVAIRIDGLACNALEEITPALKIGDADGAVSTKQVRELIGQLFDVGAFRKGLVLADMGERSMEYDICERFRRMDGSLDEGPDLTGVPEFIFNFVSGPVWKLDEVRLLRIANVLVGAARAETYPGRQREIERLLMREEWGNFEDWDSMGPVKSFTRMLSLILVPSINQVSIIHFRVVALRRMAGVALAMRVYEVDQGHRPKGLEELVGKYLAELPDDPFGDNGAKISYLKDTKQPILYSFSKDCRDDGGRFTLSEGSMDWNDSPDIPFFLNGDRPKRESDWTDPTKKDN